MTKASITTPQDSDARIGTDGSITTHVRCTQCRYDLHALPADAQCPECGRSIADSLRADSKGSKISRRDGVPIQTTGRIEQHVPCVSCHHDLCGVEATANCPECGRKVSDSLDGGRFIFAPLQHRDDVLGGTYTVLFTLTTILSLLIAAVAAGATGAYAVGEVLSALLMITLLLALFLFPVGWFMLTSDDITCVTSEEMSKARSRSRVALVIMLLGPLGALVAFFTGVMLPSELGELVGFMLLAVSVIVCFVGAVMHFFRAMTFLDLMMTQVARAPGRWLTTLARWLLVLTLVQLVAAVALDVLTHSRFAFALRAGLLLTGLIGVTLVALTYVVAVARLAMALRREPRIDLAADAPTEEA